MRMLTDQINELRKKADEFRDMGIVGAPYFLREAANTIESLRDRLQGECKMEIIETHEYDDGDEDFLCKCSNCGRKSWEPAHDLPRFCARCGMKVSRW